VCPAAADERSTSSKSTYETWRKGSNYQLIALSLVGVVGLFIIAGTVLGLMSSGGAHSHTKATIVAQKTLNRLWAPQLLVKVRFTPKNHSPVTALIHPSYRTLPSTRKPIPILYKNDSPTTAFYAGPGGDVFFATPSSAEKGILVGTCFIVIGLLLLIPVINKRRRIQSLVHQQDQKRVVHLRWQEKPKEWPTVIVTGPQEFSDYSWLIFQPPTPKDGILRRLRRSSRSQRTDAGAATRPDCAELVGVLSPHQWIVLRAGGELLIPESRAEPVIGSSPPPRPLLPGEQAALAEAHRRLLAAYAAVCSQVRLLPRFVCPPTERGLPGVRTLLCWRPSVRLHVESHIRRQLKQLADAYVRAQMLISETSKDSDKQRRFLSGLQEECKQMSASLSDIPRRVTASVVIIATLLPLVPVLVKTHQVPFHQFLGIVLTFALYVLLFLPGIFALIAYTDAFRCKRQLFISYTPADACAVRPPLENVYRLETSVFTLLSQPKHLERLSDCWANTVVLTAGIIFIVRAQPFSPKGPYAIGVIVQIIIVSLAAITIIVLTRAVVVDFSVADAKNAEARR
jgi:hypothetical protein